jgi:glycosyltransferase involved in cell wall biosynthesis
VRVISAFAGVTAWNRIPFLGDLAAAAFLAAKSAGCDVVVINGSEYAWPRIVRRKTRERTVVVWHGTRAGEIPALVPKMSVSVRIYYQLEKWLQRWALLARSQIAVSVTTKNEIETAYRTRVSICVVANGAPNIEEPRARAPGRRRVAWVGTTAYKKGLDIALAACTDARRTFEDLELIVIGIANGNDVSHPGVTYTGRLDHARSIEHLRAADVLLATSRYEGCSVAILEALALGIPIVAGPSVAWMVGDAGVAVDDFESGHYARALVELFSTPSRLDAMASAGPRQARRFDWDVAAEAYAREVERCLAS